MLAGTPASFDDNNTAATNATVNVHRLVSQKAVGTVLSDETLVQSLQLKTQAGSLSSATFVVPLDRGDIYMIASLKLCDPTL